MKWKISSHILWPHCVLLAGIVAIISNQKIASMKQQEWKVYSACILAWLVIHISMSTNFAQVNQQTYLIKILTMIMKKKTLRYVWITLYVHTYHLKLNLIGYCGNLETKISTSFLHEVHTYDLVKSIIIIFIVHPSIHHAKWLTIILKEIY